MELHAQKLPKSRRDDILIQELPEETLVYDLRTQKAHCLNETAALVWNKCDGKTTVSEIIRLLEEKMRIPVDRDLLWTALNNLEKANLLAESVEGRFAPISLSRRKVIRKIGIGAAIAAPLVLSLIIPEAAHAVSCGRQNDACSALRPCCPGCNCQASNDKCVGGC